MQQLLGAIAGNHKAMDEFASMFAGALPVPEFFNPRTSHPWPARTPSRPDDRRTQRRGRAQAGHRSATLCDRMNRSTPSLNSAG